MAEQRNVGSNEYCVPGYAPISGFMAVRIRPGPIGDSWLRPLPGWKTGVGPLQVPSLKRLVRIQPLPFEPMKASAQKIIRIQIDEETIRKLDSGKTVHFPLNDEGTELLELVGVSEQEVEQSEEGEEGLRGVA